MSYDNLYFSRYSYHFIRNEIVALFHSLKLKPLHIEYGLFNAVRNIIDSAVTYSIEDIKKLSNGDKIIEAISLLKDNRVFNDSPCRDDEVITFFRNSIGKPQVKIAYFILAESCNLSCSYCFENIPPETSQNCDSSSKIMSEKIALKSINFFERMLSLYPSIEEDKDIIFYGGEPLLNYKVLLFILKEIKKRKESSNELWNNVSLSIVTNGTLLTKDMVTEFNVLGLSIGISVDGPKEVTDENRFKHDKESVFDDIMKSIDICKSENIDFSLSVTLSERSVNSYDSVIKFIKDVNPSSIGFNLLLTNKNFSVYDGYNEDAANFLINAFKEFRKDGLYEDRMMRKVNAFVKSEVYPFDCGATGGSQLVFSPSGKIGICHGYLNGKKFFPTNVDDIDFLPDSNSVFLNWGKRSPLNMDRCQECESLGICGGGCPMNADKNHGSIWELDDRFCVHAKKTFEWLIWDLYEMTIGNK